MYLRDGYKTELNFVRVVRIYAYCVSHLAAGKQYHLLVGGEARTVSQTGDSLSGQQGKCTVLV